MQSTRFTLSLVALGALASNAFLLFETRTTDVTPRELLASLSDRTEAVSREAAPAVVSVTAYAGRDAERRGQPRVARGSGVIVRADGIIVTNVHVVRGARDVFVTLLDGEQVPAVVRGTDEDTDLAVLDIRGRRLPTLQLSEDDPPPVGTWVLALGNPLGFDHTITFGIVSARGRKDLGIALYEDFIQTDAAINSGNSGGPLIDLEGEIIGINTAKEMVPRGGQGLGFAIPAYMVRKVVADILELGHVERGYFGIRVGELSPDDAVAIGLERRPHARVNQVVDDSPADRAGFRVDDIVLAIGGQRVAQSRDVFESIAGLEPGSTVDVEVWRRGDRELLLVDVGDRETRFTELSPRE